MGNCSACCPDQTIMGDIVNDSFCGNFAIPCNSRDAAVNTLWRLGDGFFDAGAQTAATVSVYYDAGCDEAVSVRVRRRDNSVESFVVYPSNTRSLTVLNPVEVTIHCNADGGNSNTCRGKYCIDLHYDVLEPQNFG